MEALRQTQKKYCSIALTLAIVTSLIFIMADQKSIGKGLVMGAVFSIVNFIVMGETLPMRIGKSRRKIIVISAASICVRYFLLTIPLVLAINFEQFNLFSVIVGIFMVQIVILTDHVRGLISSTPRKQF